MGFLLNLGYFFAALVGFPWFLYRVFTRGDRQGLLSRFGLSLGAPLHGSIWLHGSSAGEIALLEPLVRLLTDAGVNNPIVVSAYSTTGVAAARKAFPDHRVIYFPFDLSFVVKRFIARLDPCLIVIVESEFWPNFLLAAYRRRIPVAVINGKISKRSFRFHHRLKLIPKLLRQLELITVQAQVYADRISQMGVAEARLSVTGNMKYDLLQAPRRAETVRRCRERMQYAVGDVVIIGGSLHAGEDRSLLQAFRQVSVTHPGTSIVLVPRYPRDAARVEALVKEFGLTPVLKTELDRGRASTPGRDAVLIVDTVGELRELYAIAEIAFVGGSLFRRGSNKGGHNLMEPAILGLPVLFGPYHHSFRDTAQRLTAADAGFEVRDVDELARVLRLLIDDEKLRGACGHRARQVILEGQGATRRNFELLAPLLERAALCLPVPGVRRTMPPAIRDADLG